MGSCSVAIVGAGIAGLSCALCLKQNHPQLDVTIIADQFSPDTTSDGAAGFWRPFTMSNTPDDLQTKWSVATYYYLNDLIKREDSHLIGLSRGYGYELSSKKIEKLPGFMSLIPGNRRATIEELRERYPSYIKHGVFGPCLMCEFPKFSVYMTDEYQKLGGKIRKATVEKLTDLSSEFDIVINCTGLRAKELCNDPLVFPVRGHVLRVKAPWIRNFSLYNPGEGDHVVYLLPNNDYIVVGGTKQLNNTNLTPLKETRDIIMAKAMEFEPSLKHAEIIGEWVGLRPAREHMRLEREDIAIPRSTKKLKVIHNYGMGGSGLTIGWGCALDVLELTRICLSEIAINQSKNDLYSKL